MVLEAFYFCISTLFFYYFFQNYETIKRNKFNGIYMKLTVYYIYGTNKDNYDNLKVLGNK